MPALPRSRFVIERLAVEPNLLIWFKKYRSPSSSLSLPMNMTTLEEYDNFYDDRMMIETYDDENIFMTMLLTMS